MGSKGLIDIYILEILKQHASAEKKMTQEEILYYLEEDYRVEVTRKTLSAHLRELRDEGYIFGKRGLYAKAEFADHELRLLIDGVLFGQHVAAEDAAQLIAKLRGLSSVSMKNRIRHVSYLEGINRTENAMLYPILDVIDEAIEKEKKIEVTVCRYEADGKMHEQGTRILDPYYLVTERSMYYLICYSGRNDDLENRRVDRMSFARILDEPRMPIRDLPKYRQGFDLAAYMKEHIYMFTGDSVPVHLQVKKAFIGDFIDWFGTDYQKTAEDDETVTVRIRVNENAMYYWALQYGAAAWVLRPERLRNRIRDGLCDIQKRYEEPPVG